MKARLVTASLVIALCMFTSARAVTMLRLASVENELDAAPRANAAALATLSGLRDDPVIGTRARADMLGFATGDAAKKRPLIEGLLAAAPLTSGAWRELARARLEAGEATETIIQALDMARVTGPNEGEQMAARAAFGLPIWALLPLSERGAVLRDLVGGWQEMREPDRAALRLTLSLAQPQTRMTVEGGLRRAGKPGAEVARALGLIGAGTTEK